jgi:crossover junction endodeoxyribonuclease RuvC
MTRLIRIIGIDPGLRRTGWGIIEVAGNRLGFLGCGSVTTRAEDGLAERLLAIHDGLMRILDEFNPDEAPNVVKKSIVGAGHGDKTQVRMMIGVLLPKADPQSDDAADALAIAVTHAHHRQSVLLKVAAR